MDLHSRLATLHYERYDDLANLAIELHGLESQLQQIVSAREIPATATTLSGAGQRPQLWEYADGVDVVVWLGGLV